MTEAVAPPDTSFINMRGFRRSGLNDDSRLDLTGEPPFLAVDQPKTRLAEDAFRVRKGRYGMTVVEHATIDAGQLTSIPNFDDLLVDPFSALYNVGGDGELEVRRRPQWYGLAFCAGHVRDRATVVRQRFKRDGSTFGDVEILPAFVRTVHTTPDLFGRLLHEDPTHLLARATKLISDKPPKTPNMHDGEAAFRMIGDSAVECFSTFANRAAGKWGRNEHLNLIDCKHRKADDAGDREYFSVLTDAVADEAELPYTRLTSALRKAIDLLNHVTIDRHMAGLPQQFSADDLSDMMKFTNSVKNAYGPRR